MSSSQGNDFRLAPPLMLGVLLLAGLFWQEALAAVQTWITSTAYNHCFLIVPIVTYLIWDRRFDLVGLRPSPWPSGVLLGVPLILAWLGAERLGIMEGRQLIALSFLELLLLVLLGKRMWWAMAGPLLYLYFLVPFGEFLTPTLQDVTTWFIRQGLNITGIPAFVDGYVIEIPQGSFFVAEACAGLRFLIASTAFGCLYALLMFRSPPRRALFILVAVLVPILANGLRALGIVLLGYLLGSAEAAAADHIIYGWLFFSVVILALIAAGLPFRQDHDIQVAKKTDAADFSMPKMIRTELTLLTSAAVGPLLAAATISTAEPAVIRTQRIAAMDVTWEAFSPRITAAQLLAERRRLVARALTEDAQEDWLKTADGLPSPWRIISTGEPAIAVSLRVDGKPVRPGLQMRARMAVDSLFGTPSAPMVVTVTPAAIKTDSRPSLTEFLLAHPSLDR